MASRKRHPNKAKEAKPKKDKRSPLDKALQSLEPIHKVFQKILDGKEGYRREC
jgi:hypothetical protein